MEGDGGGRERKRGEKWRVVKGGELRPDNLGHFPFDMIFVNKCPFRVIKSVSA